MKSPPTTPPAVSSQKPGTKLAAPNPQGKGQIGFLLDWEYSTPRGVVVKPSGHVLADYFTSMLILSAEFKFRPIFEREYFLYWNESGWILSILSPDDWNTAAKREAYAGLCVLHNDSTWSIEPSENLSSHGPVASAVASFYSNFVEKLDTDGSLEQGLPFYEGNLGYYQRLFASGLSRSLRASLTMGGQSSIDSRDWLRQLPRDATRLLSNQ